MKKRVAAVILLAALILSGCAANRPPQETEASALRVSFIDVGKGDCILLEKDGAFVLIDAGYADTAKDVCAFLSERGVRTLDAMIITHYDKDHVGGASAVLEAFPVRQLYLPGYEGASKHYRSLMKTVIEQSLPYRQVTEDVSLELAGVDMTIYASDVAYVPAGEKEANDNDVSLVVAAKYKKDSYLFAGDLEKAGIKAYLAKDHGAFDVVKMPHHGGYEKNTIDFIKSVGPRIAVITDSGEEPGDSETFLLLDAARAQVYSTGTMGTFTITGTGEGKYAVS